MIKTGYINANEVKNCCHKNLFIFEQLYNLETKGSKVGAYSTALEGNTEKWEEQV